MYPFNNLLISLAVILLKSACGRLHLPEFGDPMQNVTAIRGDDVKFTCSVRNIGRSMVAWIKADEKGSPTLIAFQHKIFRAKYKYKIEVQQNELWILHVRDVQVSDAGSYQCQINTVPTQSQSAYLSVQVPPTIVREKISGDIVVTEGHNVSLYCAAEGSPSPSVSWRRKDGGLITLDSTSGFGVSVVHQSNLTIHKVSRTHMTDYECHATNTIEPSETWSVKLRVHFQPTLWVDSSTNVVRALIGSDAILSCKAEAWPLPEFSWYVDGNLILDNNRKYQMWVQKSQLSEDSYDSTGRLQINDVDHEDFRIYTCKAANDHGGATATITLKQVDRRPPEDNYIPLETTDAEIFGSGDDTEVESEEISSEAKNGDVVKSQGNSADYNHVMNDNSRPLQKEQLVNPDSTDRYKQPNLNNRRSPANGSALMQLHYLLVLFASATLLAVRHH